MVAVPVGEFRPPICARCGLLRPPDAAPCTRCGLPGDACRWEGGRTRSGTPEWRTRHLILGLSAVAWETPNGAWGGSGQEQVPFSLPRGGPWYRVSESTFLRHMMGARVATPRHEAAASASLMALRLASIGAIELTRIVRRPWGALAVPPVRDDTFAGFPTGGGVDVPWARSVLDGLRERCRSERDGRAETNEWLSPIVHRPPIPRSPEEREDPASMDAAMPSDADTLALTNSMYWGLAIYLDA
jgi:hypothetical protein